MAKYDANGDYLITPSEFEKAKGGEEVIDSDPPSLAFYDAENFKEFLESFGINQKTDRITLKELAAAFE